MTESARHIQERTDTINRAIRWIEGHIDDVDLVFMTLQYTEIRQHLKENPVELVRKLRESVESGHSFGAWKGAQQVCKAAGLRY